MLNPTPVMLGLAVDSAWESHPVYPAPGFYAKLQTVVVKEQLVKLQEKMRAPSVSGDRGVGAEWANYAGGSFSRGTTGGAMCGEGPRRGNWQSRGGRGSSLGHMAETEAGRYMAPTDTPSRS